VREAWRCSELLVTCYLNELYASKGQETRNAHSLPGSVAAELLAEDFQGERCRYQMHKDVINLKCEELKMNQLTEWKIKFLTFPFGLKDAVLNSVGAARSACRRNWDSTPGVLLYFVRRVRRLIRVKNLLINEYIPNVTGEVTNFTLPRIRDIMGSNIGSETG
jgi:hypothetical protein